MKKVAQFGFLILAISTAGLFLYGKRQVILSDLNEELCCNELWNASAIEWDFQKEPEPMPKPGAIRVPIFVYHSVRPHYKGESKNQDNFDVAPELLEKELAYLKDNDFNVLSPDQLRNYIIAGLKPPKKSVMLTFDDGWRNQYKYAFPLLKKYGFTATFFVYTNAIGIKHFMTWDEIMEMDKNGMTIGDHTMSHPYFETASLADIKREVTESKKILETKLGKPIVHFASPFGYSNPAIIDILKEAGYETARTTYKGVYHSVESLLALRAILVDDSFDDFVKIADIK